MVDDFVNNLFMLSARPFGDVGEKIVNLVVPNLKERKDPTHDASCEQNKIEIKCSRARISKKVNSLTDLLTENYSSQKASLSDIRENPKIGCIFEHVKIRYFDILYYAIFTSSSILLFKISSEDLVNDKKISFCNKQTRDAFGDGQFHVKKSNIDHHLENYLVKIVKYEEICDIIA